MQGGELGMDKEVGGREKGKGFMDWNVREESKGEIRKRVLGVRDRLSREEWERGTCLCTERILGHQWFYGCEDFLCFVSFGSEIGTKELIGEALRLGKRVFVPKVERRGMSGAVMEFYRIWDMGELSPGYGGILEPSDRAERYIYTAERAERTLMLMPGVAFDAFRNRIGYGKGFYDRYLTEREGLKTRTIAVGFHCQLVERIPGEETDVRPYQVICV